MRKKSIFVTVGSTSFDGLIREIDTVAFHEAALRCGFTHMTLQIGRGSYEPVVCMEGPRILQTTFFRYADSLQPFLQSAELTISHGGAGTIMNVLRLEKKLIVVANTQLMDNHQLELATELANLQYLKMSSLDNLVATIADTTPLTPNIALAAINHAPFQSLINNMLGGDTIFLKS